jgi:hypothetical protein
VDEEVQILISTLVTLYSFFVQHYVSLHAEKKLNVNTSHSGIYHQIGLSLLPSLDIKLQHIAAIAIKNTVSQNCDSSTDFSHYT